MASIEFEAASIRVVLAIPIFYGVNHHTYISSLGTLETCLRNGIDLRVLPIMGVRYVDEARSKAVHEMLKTDATHLFFIDHDMAWRSRDFLRFIALGTKMECVSASYPFRRDPLQFMINLPEGFEDGTPIETNEWGCIPFHGTGMGFTILQRGLLERLAEKAPQVKFSDRAEPAAAIFETDVINGIFRSEDMNFFAKVRELGIPTWVDPTVDIGHVGEKVYSGKLIDYLKLTPKECVT